MTLADLLALEPRGAINLNRLGRRAIAGVSTDSRQVKRGDLFVALRGPNHDGHAYVLGAFQRGACCSVVDERADVRPYCAKPVVIVKDTTAALGSLARLHRRSFDIPVIAVAGSNGKTTTKELIASVLRMRYTVVSTEGNYNNHIGVPLTVFRMSRRHDLAVVEMGTNHFGEIRYLCEIAEPTHGLITNIGREHLEFFGDLNGVERAEGELFETLNPSGIVYGNNDDARVRRLARKNKRRLMYGYHGAGLNVRGVSIGMDGKGRQVVRIQKQGGRSFTVHLGTPGYHALENALAAAAVGISFDVPPSDIATALESFSPVGKRMEILRRGGVTILNDTYNANPDSVLAALETMRAVNGGGRKIAVLADMLEMGKAAGREHKRIGEATRDFGVDVLLTYGPMAAKIHRSARIAERKHFGDKKKLMVFLASVIKPGDSVLVKGSRGMRMEEVVESLLSGRKGRL